MEHIWSLKTERMGTVGSEISTELKFRGQVLQNLPSDIHVLDLSPTTNMVSF